MANLMHIPAKIKVGYQKRTDTYTGLLAYVIYYDEKGVLRKETSWQSWRDKSQDTHDFDNVPTEGFVLNRNGGGASRYSWDSRNEFVRVFDPRGFEFEISVANLLFILQECTSTKGKGIEGELVYAWSGTTLVLVPVNCQEYKESTAFTNLKSQKVGKALMVPGTKYQMKDTTEATYLGRLDAQPKIVDMWHSENRAYSLTDFCYSAETMSKYHVFLQITKDGTKTYRFEKGFTKVGAVLPITLTPVELLIELSEYAGSQYVDTAAGLVLCPITLDDIPVNTTGLLYVTKDTGEVYPVKCVGSNSRYKNTIESMQNSYAFYSRRGGKAATATAVPVPVFPAGTDENIIITEGERLHKNLTYYYNEGVNIEGQFCIDMQMEFKEIEALLKDNPSYSISTAKIKLISGKLMRLENHV